MGRSIWRQVRTSRSLGRPSRLINPPVSYTHLDVYKRQEYARARGAKTAAVTCNHNTPLSSAADICIVAEVGPEVVSGSTRMKAATAQKMVLNMITTGAMTRLGYVYDNLMVNVHMQNTKLVERGISILMRACNIDREAAVHLSLIHI